MVHVDVGDARIYLFAVILFQELEKLFRNLRFSRNMLSKLRADNRHVINKSISNYFPM